MAAADTALDEVDQALEELATTEPADPREAAVRACLRTPDAECAAHPDCLGCGPYIAWRASLPRHGWA
jgi:hypothetical protein